MQAESYASEKAWLPLGDAAYRRLTSNCRIVPQPRAKKARALRDVASPAGYTRCQSQLLFFGQGNFKRSARAAMAAMIATERRLRMRRPGRDPVVQNVVNWQTVGGYGGQWRGSSDWIGHPSR